MVFFDNTLFGSGKKGIAVYADFIVVNKDFVESRIYAFDEVNSIEIILKTADLVIEGRSINNRGEERNDKVNYEWTNTLTPTDKNVFEKFLLHLNPLIKIEESFDPKEKQKEEEEEEEEKQKEEDVQSLKSLQQEIFTSTGVDATKELTKILRSLETQEEIDKLSRISVAPNINKKLFQEFKETYREWLSGDRYTATTNDYLDNLLNADPLVFIVTTAFGSGEKGVAIYLDDLYFFKAEGLGASDAIGYQIYANMIKHELDRKKSPKLTITNKLTSDLANSYFLDRNNLTLSGNSNLHDSNYQKYRKGDSTKDFIEFKPEGMRGMRAYLKVNNEGYFLDW